MDESLIAALTERYALAECPEWRSLLRLLDYAEGFAFVPLIVPDYAGAEVCRRALEAQLATEGKTLLLYPLHPAEKGEILIPPLIQFPIPKNTGVLWITPDPELWAADVFHDPADPVRFEDRLWPRFLSQANQARDVIRNRIHVPVLMVGSEKLAIQARLHAPDLWSIRDTVVRPEPRADARPIAALAARGELPLDLPEFPPATGDLGETMREIERLRASKLDSPSLPELLKRAARLETGVFQWTDAEQHLTEALEWEESHPNTHFTARIDTHDLLRHLFQTTAHHERAMFHAQRVLDIAEHEFPPDHPEVGRALSNLARCLHDTNRLAEAELLMRRALTIGEAVHGKNHQSVAIQLNNLAMLLQTTNRLPEAELLMRRALEIDEASYGKDHPNVATGLNNLAQLLYDTNRMPEAERLMRRALAINERSYGKDHPKVAIRLNNLAALLQATNRIPEAEPLMRRALTINETSYGKGHPSVAIALNNLAQVLKATNRMVEAEPLMQRALEIDEAAFGKGHPNVAIDLNNLAQLLKATNHPREAEQLMLRALAIDEAAYGKHHPNVAIELNNLAQLLQATNQLTEAEPLSRRQVSIFAEFGRRTGHEHPHLWAAIGNYTGLLEKMGLGEEEIQRCIQSATEAPLSEEG